MNFFAENKKPKAAKLKTKRKYEWLKLLFETPRLGIEKEPGFVIDLEEEYRSLRQSYYFPRR